MFNDGRFNDTVLDAGNFGAANAPGDDEEIVNEQEQNEIINDEEEEVY